MPTPLTIDFALTGQGTVAKGFSDIGKLSLTANTKVQSLTKTINSATSAYKSLNTQLARYNNLTRQTPTITVQGGGAGITIGGGASGVRSGSAVSGRGGRSSTISGPYQQRVKIASALASARAGGDPNEIRDAELAEARNAKSISRLEKPPAGLSGKLMDALKTSRFSLSGGKAQLMPLVGKVAGVAAEALGPEVAALAGPVGLVAAMALSAAKGLYDLTKSAAAAGNAYAARGLALGTLGPAGAIAGAIGGPDAANKAAGFNSDITGSALGRMYGMQLGQFNLAGPYGKVDIAGQYTAAMDRLRKMPLNDAMRIANAVPSLKSSLPSLMMSDKQWSITKQQGAVQGQIMDPAFLKQSADFQQAEAGLSAAFGNLMTALGKPGMSMITSTMNALADGINKLALIINSPFVQGTIKTLQSLPLIAGGLVAGGPAGAALGAATVLQGTDKNTQAVKENTEAVKMLNGNIPGIYGKDTDGRLAAAFPGHAGYGGDFRVRKDLIHASYRLGAIG